MDEEAFFDDILIEAAFSNMKSIFEVLEGEKFKEIRAALFYKTRCLVEKSIFEIDTELDKLTECLHSHVASSVQRMSEGTTSLRAVIMDLERPVCVLKECSPCVYDEQVIIKEKDISYLLSKCVVFLNSIEPRSGLPCTDVVLFVTHCQKK